MSSPTQPELVIRAPFGYGEIVPLERGHRVLLPHGATPEFCRTTNALAIAVGEFVAAARDFPIVFLTADRGASFAPVVLLGFAERQNLFVDAGGEWDRHAYQPAYIRRYPFCVSKVYRDGQPRGSKVVCVAKAYLDTAGIALFEADGKPGPRWGDIERMLQVFERELDATAALCALLQRADLLAPFTFQVMRGEAPALKLEGMHRVDEGRLRALAPQALHELAAQGALSPIYAHLHSLENFSRMYERAARRAEAAAAPPAPEQAPGSGAS